MGTFSHIGVSPPRLHQPRCGCRGQSRICRDGDREILGTNAAGASSALSLWILLRLECAALALRHTDLDASSAFFLRLRVVVRGVQIWLAPVVTGGLSTWC